ncbi:nucleotidyltransferase domain-containing protein [Jeotgalibacillus campisalis]|nr:nucleotidyltransferase domain-containing protein [Jeotgalibacillus campisalis]
MERIDPLKAAEQFIQKHHPHCQAALLAGSVVRKEATPTSDLDIVVFNQSIESSYRSSYREAGWPIEVFVHSLESYKIFFKSDCERARPSMPNMVAEGLVIKDDGQIAAIKEEAQALLDKGPAPWDAQTVLLKRYFLTDALDDLSGSSLREEELFIANTLAVLLSEFILRINNQWIGDSKWMIRALKQFDPIMAVEFTESFDVFYRMGEKGKIIKMTEKVLRPYGGLLFEGFSLGKTN